MSQKVLLKGITWNHSRGFSPMTATAQRFSELNPGVEITWEKRSLQAFADEPIDKLAQRFDLLVIDHPWAGFAAKNNIIIPLDKYVSKGFLEDQQNNKVGPSYESYTYDGHLWALPIDAATPVASSRPDLMQKLGFTLPQNYQDLLELGKTGKVIMPGIPQDTLMNFYMFCSNLGEHVCTKDDEVVSEEIGLQALQSLRELAVNMTHKIFDWNPIQIYEALSSTDEYVYCPWAYGYSNYSRIGYAKSLLHFHDMIVVNGEKCITTLGGTGLAISKNCKALATAVAYAEFVGNETIQKTLYMETGGQPGHRKAWLDAKANTLCHDYFTATLPALDRAFLRPRYNGHMFFQDRAGAPIREYMMNGGNEKNLLDKLNALYLESKKL